MSMSFRDDLFENPYLLMTPGPLTTTRTVRQAMLRDWCTWDEDYKQLVTDIRRRLVDLATRERSSYTAVLMQGSGTFSVESVLGTVVPQTGKLLVLSNGAYGQRMGQIAQVLHIPHEVVDFGERSVVDPETVRERLSSDPSVTHVAMVHCETTTGMLNPLEEVARVVKNAGRVFIVDGMSSFGGIPMDVSGLGIDYLISSANKCIQGVPGFGFVIAKRSELETTCGQARSLSLDLYRQWYTMEVDGGKWRYTSPTHTVRAFHQALLELEAEGGIARRYRRYLENQRTLVNGMRERGFVTLLGDDLQSPFITAFLYPAFSNFEFGAFYSGLKQQGFVIYPGKVTDCNTFRIGTIGDIHRADIVRFLDAVSRTITGWQ
ncbi:MAG: 2-aminoethylphosphonate--pyruvate transaminase [Alicyclobacillus sp.]|nr:2-aminoethylphosphonate--pyruvate transaminase [Alicyclobacillus sp.]